MDRGRRREREGTAPCRAGEDFAGSPGPRVPREGEIMTAHGVRRAALVLVAAAALVAAGLWHSPAPAAATTKLGANIVKIAKAEAANKAHNHEIGGYNCNYYTTALKLAGTGARCSNHWKTEEWCADFSKWVWSKAGANTTY